MAIETAQPIVPPEAKQRWLPRVIPLNSRRYYVFLAVIAIFILGPLGGVTAAYMNFSLGFFIGGQVLAGILGSTVTYFYGAEGKHGANYMQTAAASVAGMSAMGVLMQAMIWLGLPAPETWKLILYFLCVGMLGVGVGMIYTPILVDRLQLTYPSGLAVANILRALTDVKLLKQSVRQLFTGIGLGAAFPLSLNLLSKLAAPEGTAENAETFGMKLARIGERIEATGLSTATVGAAMIIGARMTVPATMYGFALYGLSPWLRQMGWLDAGAPYRKFAFLVALGMIMGAAIVDISLILRQAYFKLREKAPPPPPREGEEWKNTNNRRLIAHVVFWATATILVATFLLDVPIQWVLFAVAFSFLMMLVNGISFGITDSNPISTAFVLSVISMAAMGLVNPIAGLLAASIVFIVCSIGGDMQQDRSTGWRLGTNRTIQFRYQVIGVMVGAVLTVFMAKLFMAAYPVLTIDTYSNPGAKVAQWQSAMTFKFVGALRGITSPKHWQIPAIFVGVGIGLTIEIGRKLLKNHEKYKEWVKTSSGNAFDFLIDIVLLPSPYASSFAGFVEFGTVVWWGLGGIFSTSFNAISKRSAAKRAAVAGEALPEDMSTMSLVGGGFLAGDSIAALVLGIIGLLALVK